MGEKESEQRSNDCKKDLQDLKDRFASVEKDVDAKVTFYMETAENLRQEFLNEQKDGGELLLNVEEMGETVEEQKAEILQKEADLEQLEMDIKAIETEITKIESEVESEQEELAECEAEEGLLPFKYEVLTAIGLAAGSAALTYRIKTK